MTAPIARKVCLLGDFAVGKTSLVRRFVDNQFSDAYLSTIGVKISRTLVRLDDTNAIQLVLWDLEGRGNSSGAGDSYLLGAAGAIIVGDITRKETIAHIDEHVAAFITFSPTGKVVVAINKTDLRESETALPSFERRRQVISVQLTSAKSGDGVQTIFETLGKNFLGT